MGLEDLSVRNDIVGILEERIDIYSGFISNCQLKLS